MKGDTQVVLLISFGILGFSLGVASNLQTLSMFMGIIEPVATLIAAFAGSFFAFKLHEKHEIKKEKKSHEIAGNRVISGLLMQANTIKNFQDNFITPARDRADRHLYIQACLPYEISNPTINAGEDLNFFEKKKHRQIAYEIAVECNRYKLILQAINQRSKLLIEEIQPAMEKAGIEEDVTYDEKYFVDAIGQKNYKTIERLTNDIISLSDDFLVRNVQLKSELITCIKEIYPDSKPTNYELIK